MPETQTAPAPGPTRVPLPLIHPDPGSLSKEQAEDYAEWFSVLSDPTRVRLLHVLSTSTSGALKVGDLAQRLGISQSTCSHHVELLARWASWSSTRSATRRWCRSTPPAAPACRTPRT